MNEATYDPAPPPGVMHGQKHTPEFATGGLVRREMTQTAPWPDELVELVNSLRYREHMGWRVTLVSDLARDPATTHKGESRGLTLVVTRCGPDTYHPVNVELRARELLDAMDEGRPVAAAAGLLRAAVDALLPVNHYFAVPPATYNRASWMRWLFDRLGDVDTHERMEDFTFATRDVPLMVPELEEPVGEVASRLERPYAPVHAPGWDPYLITTERTAEDRRTSYRGELNPE